MQNDKKSFTLLDGSTVEDMTDWERLNAMTDEEVTAAALSDPDAQPLTDEQMNRARRLADLPGSTLAEKLRTLADENKKLVSVRYDADVIAFFQAHGKGYQRLMNNVLRDYMNKQIRPRA